MQPAVALHLFLPQMGFSRNKHIPQTLATPINNAVCSSVHILLLNCIFFFSNVSDNRLKAMCDYQQTMIKDRKTFAVNFRTSTFT